ncbi:response regulator transcription factor [Halobacteriovorax sp. GFR7]|uniref:response regulator transcription factor n=1 Tax=unclassified Halobacteriovorax TaxID=2639665 RepID=UPI003718F2BF
MAKECRLYSRGKNQSLCLNRVAKTLESLTKSVDQSAISPENPLTAREAEVLELVSLGYTNKEMANALSISEKTIEYHMSSIFKKTQASKRTEAVTNALKFKWLEAS